MGSTLLSAWSRVSQCRLGMSPLPTSPPGDWLTYRNQLARYCSEFKSRAQEDIYAAQRAYSQQIQAFLAKQWKEAEAWVGPNPQQLNYCLFGLGSLARKRMVAYPDVECGLLIHQTGSVEQGIHWGHPESPWLGRTYQIWTLLCYNLGESLEKGVLGLRLDEEGNPGEVRLLGTSAQLVARSYQSKSVTLDEHLTYSLLTPCYLVGDEHLLAEFQFRVKQWLEDSQPGAQTGQQRMVQAQIRYGQQLLQAAFARERTTYALKTRYLTPLSYFLSTLALHYDPLPRRPEQAIVYLDSRQRVTEALSQDLMQALDFLYRLRSRLHFQAGQQSETVVQNGLTPSEQQRLTHIEWGLLRPAHRVLRALEQGQAVAPDWVLAQWNAFIQKQSTQSSPHAIPSTQASLSELDQACIHSLVATLSVRQVKPMVYVAYFKELMQLPSYSSVHWHTFYQALQRFEPAPTRRAAIEGPCGTTLSPKANDLAKRAVVMVHSTQSAGCAS